MWRHRGGKYSLKACLKKLNTGCGRWSGKCGLSCGYHASDECLKRSGSAVIREPVFAERCLRSALSRLQNVSTADKGKAKVDVVSHSEIRSTYMDLSAIGRRMDVDPIEPIVIACTTAENVLDFDAVVRNVRVHDHYLINNPSSSHSRTSFIPSSWRTCNVRSHPRVIGAFSRAT